MSNYSVKTIARTAVPRSKRLREGAAPEGGTTGSWGLTGGHTHSNKDALDLFRYDPARNVIYVGDEDNPINLAAYGQVSGGGINGETPTPVTTTLGGLMNVTNEADNVQTVDKILVRRANASGNNSWTLANLSDISGTVVGIRMNGTVKSPGTDKIVDLGTIITSLAGYATETYVSNNFLASSLKGAANGLAELGSDGKVPSSQLPSYVDDVLEYSSTSAFPATGESGKIYVALDTNKTYRWGGSEYVEISASLALGETSSTAYRGDRGKIAYDHSQISGGSTVHHTHSNKAALDLLRYDAQKNLLYIGDENNRINFAAYGAVSAGGIGSGGGGGARCLYQLEDVLDYRTSYRGKYLRAKSDGSGTEWVDVQGGASAFNDLTGRPSYNGSAMTSSTNIPEVRTSYWNGKQDAITSSSKLSASLVSGLATVATSGAYGDLSGKPTALKNPYSLTFGSKSYDGSSAKEIVKGDLGLGNVENKSSATIRGELTASNVTTALGYTPYNAANISSASVASANVLTTYAANGSSDLTCLQNIFSTVPKSVGTAVRLQHGSHSMALGWFLSGYDYEHAYGGWFISDYGTPSWVGVDNGNWKVKNFAFTSDIPTNNNQLTNGAGYITSSGSCAYATSAGTATNLANNPSLSFTSATSASAGSTLTVTAGGKTSSAVTIDKVRYSYNAGQLNGHADSYFATASSLGNYLPLSGGTMTGLLKVKTGLGIEDATGNGLLAYHPTSWTAVTSSQWGVGATDSQGVIRSNNSNLLHYKGGSSYIIYDAGNCNNTSTSWACSNLTASGNIVGSGQVAAGSDIRWKENITPVRPNVIDCLNPVEWDWKEGHGNGHSAGLIAQQVARILPFAVMGNEADGYVLNYNVFHAYEISELQSLRQRVAELERKLNIFKH